MGAGSAAAGMPQQMMYMQPQFNNQQLRHQQIMQLMQFFIGTQMIDKTAEKEEFRVPLILTKSKNPFFVKVGVPFTFPNQRP